MILELDSQGPKYRQLTRALRSAILNGDLRPGTRVPASRDLARQLPCSRNLVVLAYEQLLAEGYLVATPRGGTFVSRLLPDTSTQRTGEQEKPRTTPGLSPAGRRLANLAAAAREIARWPRSSEIDFMFGVAGPDTRLTVRLRQGFARCLRDPSSFHYPDPAGDEGLRAQIAQRLLAMRGIRRPAAQIVITDGAQQALDICARLLVSPGDVVVVEDPGYEAARAAFAAAGATLVAVPVDEEGLDPDRLPRRLRRARLVYVTPSHQFPTGAILTAARRQALLAWARAHGAYVLEDDYDGELRYSGQPLRALAGVRGGSDVIYCGTFAKSLFPSVRLGYLSLPESLEAAAISAKWLTDRGSSTLLQRLVRELMASGEYERHIRRMHRRYAARRATMVRVLREQLGSKVRISGDAAGLHLVAWLPGLTPADIDALVHRCAKRSVGIYSIARHALGRLPCGGLLLGYGLVDEAAIETGVRTIAAVYRELR